MIKWNVSIKFDEFHKSNLFYQTWKNEKAQKIQILHYETLDHVNKN